MCGCKIFSSGKIFCMWNTFIMIKEVFASGKFPWLWKVSWLWKISRSLEIFLTLENFLDCQKYPCLRKISLVVKNFLDLGRFPWLWKTTLDVRNFLDCAKPLYCGKLLFLYCPWSRQKIGLRLSKMKPYKKY